MDKYYIYNILPLLAGPSNTWIQWAQKAKSMGFNWIYLNPIQLPGLSGSIYSIKDYYKVNPALLENKIIGETSGYEEIQLVFREMKQLGMKIMVDLVINHTAIDSPLVKEHPEWYKLDENGIILHPSAIDPADAREITVWGDLYEIDNEESKEKEELWEYWGALVETLVKLGVDGFRCDAAYKVPYDLWESLIKRANSVSENPIAFVAETLGCRLDEVKGLKKAGFSLLYNSSKYWNFDASWAVDQHLSFKQIAPSVSFPESHDTARLSSDTNGNENVAKQRYAFCLFFSKAIQISMGFEFGWKKSFDVVNTTPDDQEKNTYDIISYITELNKFAMSQDLFNEEGALRVMTPFSWEHIILEKSSIENQEAIYAIINKNWTNSLIVELPFKMEIVRPFTNETDSWKYYEESIELGKAEIVFGRKVI